LFNRALSILYVYMYFYVTAWAGHVRAVKNHNMEQLRICKAYVRWKWRQRILHIMKVWRHQALYGRTDGLYSRQMLLKTLAEQKFSANVNEKLMADQTMELEECRALVAVEVEKRKSYEEELKAVTAERDKNKMTNHHFEQELRRVQSIIDCMVELNPNQVKHIHKIQPDFKFKERNIVLSKEPSAEEKAAAMAAKEARKLAAEKEKELQEQLSPSTSNSPSPVPISLGSPSGDTAGGDVGGGGVGSPQAMHSSSSSPSRSLLQAALTGTGTGESNEPLLTPIQEEGSCGTNTPTTTAAAAVDAVVVQQIAEAAVGGFPSVGDKAAGAEADVSGAEAGEMHREGSTIGSMDRADTGVSVLSEGGRSHDGGGGGSVTSVPGEEGDAAAGAMGGVGALLSSDGKPPPSPLKPSSPPKTPGAMTASERGGGGGMDTENREGGNFVSDEDKVLLMRVKWLLKRFHDVKHQQEHDAHTKTSLQLMKDAAAAQAAKNNAAAAAAMAAESGGTAAGPVPGAGAGAGAGGIDGGESFDGLYPLAPRPSILPGKALTAAEMQHAALNLTDGRSALTLAQQEALRTSGPTALQVVDPSAAPLVVGENIGVRPGPGAEAGASGTGMGMGMGSHPVGVGGHSPGKHIPHQAHRKRNFGSGIIPGTSSNGGGGAGAGGMKIYTGEEEDTVGFEPDSDSEKEVPAPGLDSFSGSPGAPLAGSRKLGAGGRKSPEQIGLDSAAAVQSALAFAASTAAAGGGGGTGGDNGPGRAPMHLSPLFGTRHSFQSGMGAADGTTPTGGGPSPMLKNQVRQMSKQFGQIMRQSSSVMYRSMRGRADSTMSETDISVTGEDPMDDIPLAEIDEMDSLKNASVKILLTMLEFLESGTIGLLAVVLLCVCVLCL
jgi:hypothetical protein